MKDWYLKLIGYGYGLGKPKAFCAKPASVSTKVVNAGPRFRNSILPRQGSAGLLYW